MLQGLPPTRAEYRSLWYAAIAVIEMCVRHGRSGIATELGEFPTHRISKRPCTDRTVNESM